MKPAAAHESTHATRRRPAAVLASVKNTYPRQFRVGTAINDEQFAGFGDAVAAAAPPGSRDITMRDIGIGDEHRAPLSMIVRAVAAGVADALRSAARRWRQRREMRRTYEALSGLDARTLRDIGVGDREIGSIAAELAGRAERSRMQAVRSPHQPAF